MSRSEKAGEYFHGRFGDNCAQAVIRAHADQFSVTEDNIREHSKDGGGRAEGGMCGALVAAINLVPEKREQLIELFSDSAGSHLCRDIRKDKKVSCRECVEKASVIIDSLQ